MEAHNRGQFDLGPYCLQFRLSKLISRRELRRQLSYTAGKVLITPCVLIRASFSQIVKYVERGYRIEVHGRI